MRVNEAAARVRAKHIRSRLPVYKKALPFAVPIFVGVALSILFGNVMLFVLPTV